MTPIIVRIRLLRFPLFGADGEISFSGRLQILEDGSLLIAKVRSTDRGKYSCVRANEAGSVRAEAWVQVMVRTQIVQPPVDTKVNLVYCNGFHNVFFYTLLYLRLLILACR